MKSTLTLPFFFLSGLYVLAQDIVTDRPDQTEASSIIPMNSLQLEAGFILEKTNKGEQKAFLGPSLLLRYSLNKLLEIRVFNQYEHFSISKENYKINGVSDLELGVKLQLFKKDGSNTEIALLSHLVIPTAKGEISNQTLGVISKLCISHSLNDWIGIGYNLGYAYLEEKHSFIYSLALGFSITEKIGLYMEPYGVYTENGDYESNFDAGFTYLLKQNFQLDASYGSGLNHNMNYVSLGFSWNMADVF